MKPIKLDDFMVKSSIARRIAKARWSEINDSIKTNRKYVYYYSCAGHGGYVLDPKALTDEEREEISGVEDGISTSSLLLFVQHRTDGTYILKTSTYYLSKIVGSQPIGRADLSKGDAEWIEYPVYLFEEDCAWSVLEYFTDVRLVDVNTPDDERIKETVENWYPQYFDQEVLS